MDKKQKHNSQLRRITSADVDLTTSISRDEFVSFLDRILEGLLRMTWTSNYHHGGDFCNPTTYGDGSQIENYINKLKRILEILNKYGLKTDSDWENREFTLEGSLWGILS